MEFIIDLTNEYICTYRIANSDFRLDIFKAYRNIKNEVKKMFMVYLYDTAEVTKSLIYMKEIVDEHTGYSELIKDIKSKTLVELLSYREQFRR